jgi:ferredoxin-NADP reductase
MQTWEIQLLSKNRVTDDVLIMQWTRPSGFTFDAGQFVQFLIPQQDGHTPRAYSLSSTPADDTLEFCAKILPHGVASSFFEQASEGDSATIRGPRGMFTVQTQSDLFMIATGVGIAPIMSILRDELKCEPENRSVRLIFGLRSKQDLFWQEELHALAAIYPHFSHVTTLSQPHDAWTGKKGRVTSHIPQSLTAAEFYVCGNPVMVKDVRALLLSRGVEKSNIYFEIF